MQKHIVIDARIRQSSTGRYVDRLLENLQSLDSAHKFTVLLHPNDTWQPRAKNFQPQACRYGKFSINPLQHLGFALFLRRLQPDLVHFTIAPQQPIFYRKNFIVTTHDLTVLQHSTNDSIPSFLQKIRVAVYRFMLRAAHRGAKHVITPTQHAADSVNKYHLFTNRKTTVTLESSDPPLPSAAKKPAHPPEEFIMYTGRNLPHKNLPRLISAFALLKEHHTQLNLVLVGKRDARSKQLEKWARKQPYFEDIIFTGFVPDEELKWYYQNARAYVFPSLSEGFGLPGLEAAAHGCPVVSSNYTCLPEVLADGAHYFDPLDIQDMAQKIDEVISRESLRKKLIANGRANLKRFSWRKMAKQTHAIYEKYL